MKLIRIKTCFNEILICVLYYKSNLGLHTDKGFILYDEIDYFDYIGDVVRRGD